MKLIKELAKRPNQANGILADSEANSTTEGGPGLGMTQISTHPNIFGGHDAYQNGVLVSTSHPNIFGGFDKTIYSLHGHGDAGNFGHEGSALDDILSHHDNSGF